MTRFSARTILACLAAASVACLAADEAKTGASPGRRWRQHEIRRPKPPVVEPAPAGPAVKPPGDAVVLFDGTNLDAWKSADGGPARWKVEDGALVTVPGAGMIETKRAFGDIQLHIEWATPPEPSGVGQDRGNSGVFLMKQFEIQVLDSYKAETYADGQAAAIYGQYPPLANASRPPGEWQTYDIAFRRPRFGPSGSLVEPARITVIHNGVLVQNNEEPFGPTYWLRWQPYDDRGESGPIALQDHDHPVRFRNIWLRELPARPEPRDDDLARPARVELAGTVLDRYAGSYQSGAKPDAPVAVIRRAEDHLTIKFPFLPGPLAIEPISEVEFDMPHTDGRVKFQVDGSGKVTGLLFRVGDGEREMRRLDP